MILWYSLPSSNLKLAASSRLWAKVQGFSSYVVFFQKYTNVLIFWSWLYTGKIKTWKVQRGTSKMVLFHVKNLTVSLSLLWKANMQVFKVHKFDLTFDCWWLVIIHQLGNIVKRTYKMIFCNDFLKNVFQKPYPEKCYCTDKSDKISPVVAEWISGLGGWQWQLIVRKIVVRFLQ